MPGSWVSSIVEYILQAATSFRDMVWHPPPLLPVALLLPHPNIQNLELGKLLLPIAAASALGLVVSPASGDRQFVACALMAGFTILWIGTALRELIPGLASMLIVLGSGLVLLFFSGLVATFFQGGAYWFCWVCGCCCLIPFLCLVMIKPQPPAP